MNEGDTSRLAALMAECRAARAEEAVAKAESAAIDEKYDAAYKRTCRARLALRAALSETLGLESGIL